MPSDDSAPAFAQTTNSNIHSLSAFIPTYDGSFPIQDFIREVQEAARLGAWDDTITLKVAKSKIQGTIGNMVRNRHDLNFAETFKDFAEKLIQALHTEKPVSVRLQDLMTCVQLPDESVDAYATRIRHKAKGLTEWDVSPETQSLKNKTVTAAFVKGLQPTLRQHVLPLDPPDFEKAIALARSYEISQSLLPSNDTPSAAAAVSTGTGDAAMLEIQKRIASLELSVAENTSRGRGFRPRGRGRGRQPHRQNFQDRSNPNFRQSQSWAGPPFSSRHYSRNHSEAPQPISPHYSPCRCCSRSRPRYHSSHEDRCHSRSPSRHLSYGRTHSRSTHGNRHHSRSPTPTRRQTYRGTSRSPDRHRRHDLRSPSASPSRSRYQSPKGYRSRH